MLRRALICFLIVPGVGAQTLPFWKTKEKVYSRIENGEIIVSVKTEGSRLGIAGGGQVRAPRDFVFDYAREFDHLDHLGIYVDKAHYNPATSTVDMTMSALGLHADFKVLVHSDAASEPRRIDFEIVEGPVKGLKGVLDFNGLKAEKTEVGIRGEYDYTDQKMFKLVFEFGLEVMFQKMAARLRDHVQKAYRDKVASP